MGLTGAYVKTANKALSGNGVWQVCSLDKKFEYGSAGLEACESKCNQCADCQGFVDNRDNSPKYCVFKGGEDVVSINIYDKPSKDWYAKPPNNSGGQCSLQKCPESSHACFTDQNDPCYQKCADHCTNSGGGGDVSYVCKVHTNFLPDKMISVQPFGAPAGTPDDTCKGLMGLALFEHNGAGADFSSANDCSSYSDDLKTTIKQVATSGCCGENGISTCSSSGGPSTSGSENSGSGNSAPAAPAPAPAALVAPAAPAAPVAEQNQQTVVNQGHIDQINGLLTDIRAAIEAERKQSENQIAKECIATQDSTAPMIVSVSTGPSGQPIYPGFPTTSQSQLIGCDATSRCATQSVSAIATLGTFSLFFSSFFCYTPDIFFINFLFVLFFSILFFIFFYSQCVQNKRAPAS